MVIGIFGKSKIISQDRTVKQLLDYSIVLKANWMTMVDANQTVAWTDYGIH